MAHRSQKNLNANNVAKDEPLKDLFTDSGLIRSICARAPLDFDEQLQLLRVIRKEFDLRLAQIARFPRSIKYLIDIQPKHGKLSQRDELVMAYEETQSLWSQREQGGSWSLNYLTRLRKNQRLVLNAMEELHTIDDYPYARELRLRQLINSTCKALPSLSLKNMEDRQRGSAAIEEAEMLPLGWIERAATRISACDKRMEWPRNELVETNARFIVKVLEFTKAIRGPDDADLVQEGALALFLAAERYREERGSRGKASKLKFTTLAGHWIRRAISGEIRNRDFIKIPEGTKELLKDLERRSESRLADSATEAVSSAKTGLRRSKQDERLRQAGAKTVSLNKPLSEDSENDLGTLIKAKKVDQGAGLDRELLLERFSQIAPIILQPLQLEIFNRVKSVWGDLSRQKIVSLMGLIGGEINLSIRRVDQIFTDALDHFYWYSLLQGVGPEFQRSISQRILLPYERMIFRNLLEPKPTHLSELELVTEAGIDVDFEHQSQVLKKVALAITLRDLGKAKAEEMMLAYQISPLGRYVVLQTIFSGTNKFEQIAKLACDQGLADPSKFFALQAHREFRKAAIKLAPFLRIYSQRNSSNSAVNRRSL